MPPSTKLKWLIVQRDDLQPCHFGQVRGHRPGIKRGWPSSLKPPGISYQTPRLIQPGWDIPIKNGIFFLQESTTYGNFPALLGSFFSGWLSSSSWEPMPSKFYLGLLRSEAAFKWIKMPGQFQKLGPPKEPSKSLW